MATQKNRASDAVKKARKQIEKAREDARDATQKRAAQVALSIVDFQKKIANSTIDGLGRAQEEAGKALHNLAKNAKWAPEEARDIIDEWNATTKKSREDFKKSMNKSFDLLHKLFSRMQKPAKKKAATKKKAAKKKATKRKAAPKKKAASRKKPAAAS